MDSEVDPELSFSEWQALTDAYAAAIAEMEAGKPESAAKVTALCGQVIRALQRVTARRAEHASV
jgi:hypothetical protein